MATERNEFAGTGDGDNGADSGSVIDPATLSGGSDDFDPNIHVGRDKRNADGTYTRKRGRRAGSGNSASGTTRKSKTSSDLKDAVETLSRTLIILHAGIAGATRAPEMVLTDNEASMLSAATVNVLEQFDIRPDPKIEAVVGLVVASTTIYVPRMYLIRARIAKEKEDRRQTAASPADIASGVVIDMAGTKVN